MEQTKQNLLDQLLRLAQSLSTDKLIETLDFVSYLHDRTSRVSRPERGSTQAILSHSGKWRFEAGELDQLLVDIALMRAGR